MPLNIFASTNLDRPVAGCIKAFRAGHLRFLTQAKQTGILGFLF